MKKFRITSIPQNKKLNTFAEGGGACPRGYIRDASGKCVPYNFNDVQAVDSYTGMYGGYDSSGVKNLKQVSATAKKGKKFSDYVLRGGKSKADVARNLGKTAGQYFGMPGEAIEPTNFTKAGLEKYTKTVKDAKKNFDAEAKNYQDYLKSKEKVATNKMDTRKYADKYNEKNWSQYDQTIAKGSGPDADYSAKEARQNWGDSDEWKKFTGLVSNAATAIPLLGAAGAAGTAGAAVFQNPLVQAGMTGYGVYDAATNTIPEAYRNFSEGNYLKGFGNAGLAALDLLPGAVFGDFKRAGQYLNKGSKNLKELQKTIKIDYPIQFGDETYKLSGEPKYHVDPLDYQGLDWKKEGIKDFLNEDLKDPKTYKFITDRAGEGFDYSDATQNLLRDSEFKTFSPGWEEIQSLKARLGPRPKQLTKDDFFTDKEILDLANQQKKYWDAQNEFDALYPETPQEEIMGLLTGNTERDELFSNLYPNVGMPDFRSKFTNLKQEELLQNFAENLPSIRNKGLLGKGDLKKFADTYTVPQDSTLLKTAQKLKKNENNFLQTAKAKDVVKEMRGSLGLKLDEIDKATPEQLEKWRQQIVKKSNKQDIERYKKDIEKPYTGFEAYQDIFLDAGDDFTKEIKNVNHYKQLLDTYDDKALSIPRKKYYSGLINKVKSQGGKLTERQYNDLQRLKTGNFNFGIKGNFSQSKKNPYNEMVDSPSYREWKEMDPENIKSADQQIDEGNKWLQEWMSDPATQKRIKETGFADNPKVKKNLEDYISGKNIVKGFVPDFDNYQLAYGHYIPSKNKAFVDITNPNFMTGEKSIPSTTLHEGTHIVSKGDAAYSDEIKDDVMNIFTDDNWSYDRMRKNAGASRMFDAPEVHARIMQLRQQYGIRPGQKVDQELIDKIVKEGLEGKTFVSPKFFEKISSNDNFKKAFNKLPAVVPIAATAAGTASMMANPFQGSDGLQQQKKGGATKNFIELELPKNKIQDYINQGYIVEEID